jgi:hypothetical protein
VAAGDGDRDYSQVFLDFGVMLIGPGDRGSYLDSPEAYANVTSIREFVETVKPNDLVILKRGLRNIVAAGVVEESKENYFHSEVFGDVDGYCLQHGRYVKWYKPHKKVELRLPRGRLTRSWSSELNAVAENIVQIGTLLKPRTIPPLAKEVNDEKLIVELIDEGLSSGQAQNVVAAFHGVRRLGGWYEKNNEGVSEHETRTFLIVPLLLALGWPEQRLKIEWHNIDIAFFENNYAEKNKPTMILESKRLDSSLFGAEKQAKNYSNRFPKCEKLIVSNGLNYLLFSKKGNEWTPRAFFNVLKPLDRHPYREEIGGAADLMRQLLPK